MIVVSDSTPLITLMKAMQLDLLHLMFGEVLIPEAVFEEVTQNDTFQDEAELIKGSSFIRVIAANNPEHVRIIQRATGLDRGESEAIVCADELKADLLLMDESHGRKVAQNMHLPISGSIGIIVRACRDGYLTVEKAENALQKIQSSNRHISKKLIEDAIRIIRGT